MSGPFHVYILASASRRLYVGVTNDLARRLGEHRSGDRTPFTGKYNITRLVHVEPFPTAIEAIAREKQVKGWSRAKKLALVEADNPQWRDRSADAEFARMLR
jgi:putative endonuclease